MLAAAFALVIVGGTITLCLLENVADFWLLALLGAVPVYLLAGGLVAWGVKHARHPSLKPERRRAFFGLSLVLLVSTATAFTVAGAVFLPPEPEIYPRQYPVVVPAGYRFTSQHGDLNQTCVATFTRATSSPTDPAAYAWGESYYQRILHFQYLATRNASVLADLMARIAVVRAHADWNNDSVPGFGTAKYEGSYVEYLVWDGMIVLPWLEVANTINADPALWQVHASVAEAYVQAAETILQKWNRTHWREGNLPGHATPAGLTPMGYYVSPPGNDRAIFNRIHALGRVALALYKYTGNETYRAHAAKIARFFKAHLQPHDYTLDGVTKTMYTWGYDATGTNSDTSHACIDAEFVAACHAAGIVFTAEDVTRFANTFVDFYYRGRDYQVSVVHGGQNFTNVLAHNVNGKEKPYDTRRTDDGQTVHVPGYYRNLRHGWLLLHAYYADAETAAYVVYQVLEDLVRGGNTTTVIQQALWWLRYATYVAGQFQHAFA